MHLAGRAGVEQDCQKASQEIATARPRCATENIERGVLDGVGCRATPGDKTADRQTRATAQRPDQRDALIEQIARALQFEAQQLSEGAVRGSGREIRLFATELDEIFGWQIDASSGEVLRYVLPVFDELVMCR